MLLLAAATAAVAADIRIEAAVGEDLRTITGTMTVSEDLVLVDPLARLPEPTTDRDGFRTYPGRSSRGQVAFDPPVDGVVSFRTTLPKRYGAIGSTSHGMFASGGWYPQPEGLPISTWSVTVTLPEGTAGALGSEVGTGTLTWTGMAERAPLAVVRRPWMTPITDGEHVALTLLTQGKPRKTFTAELTDQAELLGVHLKGAVVEGPLRRRLVRPAPGLLYISDRAFRVTAGLRIVHREAVAAGLAEAFTPSPDPYVRSLVGAALGSVTMAGIRPTPAEVLGKIDWIPYIDSLKSTRTTPYYAEILGTTWPGDPIRDDLGEIFAPFVPGRVVLAQTDDRYGAGTSHAFARALLELRDVEAAAVRAGVDPAWLEGWRRPFPPQDYTLEADGSSVVTVTRNAPPDAPREVIVLRADDHEQVLDLPPGRHRIQVAPGYRRLTLDPALHTQQLSRLGDAWPPRYVVTFIVRVAEIDLSQKQITFGAQATLRREGNTRSQWFASINHTTTDIVNAGIGRLWKAGPLLDAFNRLRRFRVDVSAAYLDADFAASDQSRAVMDGSLSYSLDNRTAGLFPLRGGRLAVSGGGGGIPGTPSTWISGGLQAVGVASIGPRFAFAGRATAAAARSDVPHRLLVLGGEGSMRSLPELPACPPFDDTGEPFPCLEVATERAHAAVEARCALIRGWSVPGILAWGTELQLAVGLEGVLARLAGEGTRAWALGVTTGVVGAGDVLGLDEIPIGLGVAWSIATDGINYGPTFTPQFVLRFGQAF